MKRIMEELFKTNRWYLLSTKSRSEKTAYDNLNNQGHETFLPTLTHTNKPNALFPGYIFVKPRPGSSFNAVCPTSSICNALLSLRMVASDDKIYSSRNVSVNWPMSLNDLFASANSKLWSRKLKSGTFLCEKLMLDTRTNRIHSFAIFIGYKVGDQLKNR